MAPYLGDSPVASDGFSMTSSSAQEPRPPVIIIGAGMTGLTLAQALKKAGVPCEVFERDEGMDTEKGHGWALTVHWALPAFEECLPENLFNRLDSIQVDPEMTIKDTGRFMFLNLKTGVPKFVIPPSKRMRINRKLLKATLSEGIDVHYGKTVESYTMRPGDPGSVDVSFTDGTTTPGSILVGTDGRSSRTRRLMLGDEGRPNSLSIRSIGCTTVMTAKHMKSMLEIDPLLFQGSHPDTHVYNWFSLVSTPAINGSIDSEEPYWAGQLIQSWLHESEADEVPSEQSERLAILKRNAQHFFPPLRDFIAALPEDTKCINIKWEDWTPCDWNTYQGRITLAGDSAHAMTSYRGEAFNHAITDAATLSRYLVEAWKNTGVPLEEAVSRYEKEMRARTTDAVILSTDAAYHAHDLDALESDSPLVSKRAKVARDVMPPKKADSQQAT